MFLENRGSDHCVFFYNRFSPNDSKFASCSDDSYIRIFDFMTGVEERELRGLFTSYIFY